MTTTDSPRCVRCGSEVMLMCVANLAIVRAKRGGRMVIMSQPRKADISDGYAYCTNPRCQRMKRYNGSYSFWHSTREETGWQFLNGKWSKIHAR